MKQIKVSEFTVTPGPRYIKQGSYSAEEFYTTILEPEFTKAILMNESVVVNLDNVYGYFPSFLDETFGRLTQKFGKNYVRKYLKLISRDDPERISEVFTIIDNFDKNGFSNDPNKLKAKEEQENNNAITSYSKSFVSNNNSQTSSYLFILGEFILLTLAVISFVVSILNPGLAKNWNIIFCASVIISWCYCLFGINSDFIATESVHNLAIAGFALSNILSFLGIILIYCIK